MCFRIELGAFENEWWCLSWLLFILLKLGSISILYMNEKKKGRYRKFILFLFLNFLLSSLMCTLWSFFPFFSLFVHFRLKIHFHCAKGIFNSLMKLNFSSLFCMLFSNESLSLPHNTFPFLCLIVLLCSSHTGLQNVINLELLIVFLHPHFSSSNFVILFSTLNVHFILYSFFSCKNKLMKSRSIKWKSFCENIETFLIENNCFHMKFAFLWYLLERKQKCQIQIE